MKKNILICFFILIGLFMLKSSTVNAAGNSAFAVNGTVKDKNGAPVEGVTVYLSGDKTTWSRVQETGSDGKYGFVCNDSLSQYYLKFDYNGKLYNSSTAYEIVKTYEGHNCDYIKVGYGVPKGEEADIELLIHGNLITLAGQLDGGMRGEKETISYNEQGLWYQNSRIDESNICLGILSKMGTLSYADTNIVIVIKINKKLPSINSVINKLKEGITTNGKYQYFVLLGDDLDSDTKNTILRELNGAERTKVSTNAYELLDCIWEYAKGEPNKSEVKVGDGDSVKVITGALSGNSEVNVKMGERSLPVVDTGVNITGAIYIGNQKLQNHPIEISLKKGNTPKTGTINNQGCFGFDYFGEGDSRRGTYTIETSLTELKINNQETYKGYNGQNYDIDKIEIRKDGSLISTIENPTSNRENIDEKFSPINKDNAALVKKVNSSRDWDTMVEYTRLTTSCDINVWWPDQETEEESEETEEVSEESDEEEEPFVPPSYEVNFYFKERPKFELDVETKIAAAEMILSDGKTLKTYKAGETILPYWQVDDEISHGATINIEYEITVKNTEEVNCENFTLIDYLDYGNSMLQYRKDAKLITEEDKTNTTYANEKSYNWRLIDTDREYNELNNKTVINLEKGKTYLEIKDSIGANEEKTYKLIASVVITNVSESKYNFKNAAEIIEYANNIGRVDTDSIPGNMNPDPNKEACEKDESNLKEPLKITPPTGIKPKWYTSIVEIILNNI